jgi:hypothetical protein
LVNEVFVNKNFEFQNELERDSLQRQEIRWSRGLHGLARILALREEGYPQIALILADINERPETSRESGVMNIKIGEVANH